MTDILDYICTWSVFKWIILVLIAGFISQFGRMTAEAIVKKIRQRRAKKSQLSGENAPQPDLANIPAYGSDKPSVPPANSDRAEKLDKKHIKAMAKARKKEAKKRK